MSVTNLHIWFTEGGGGMEGRTPFSFLLGSYLFLPVFFQARRSLVGRQSADLNREREGVSIWTLSRALMQSSFQTLTCGVSHIHRACICVCVCVFRWSWLSSTWLSLTLISSVKLLDGCIAVNPLASIINLGLTVSRPVRFAAAGSTHSRYKMCAAHVCTGPLCF